MGVETWRWMTRHPEVNATWLSRLLVRRDGAEAEVARLRDGLRPFVEDYDFHAADYLADDEEARVFTARTVESLIEDQRKARALLADQDGAALTAGESGVEPDGTGRVAPADGCAERQSTADPSPAASDGAA